MQNSSGSILKGGVTAPVVANGAVYAGIGPTGGLYALSAVDGSLLWHALDDIGVTAAAVDIRTEFENLSI